MATQTKKHKYVVLQEKLQTKFLKLKPHSQIPSVRQLATQYDVSSMTVRQALMELQNAGLIYTIPGSGTYVAGEKLSKKLVFISFTEEIKQKGMKPSSKILKAEKVKISNKKLAEALQIQIGESAYRIMRVRLADKVALMENGKITAVGKHSDLLASNEHYRYVISSLDEEKAVNK